MDFLNGSVSLGRWFGINVRIHVLFLFFIGYELITSRGAWQSELYFYGMLFGIVLIHEFGHCFGARSVGGDADQILMWPLGGLAFARAPMTPWAQFVTVACGPLVNVIFCALSLGFLMLVNQALDVVSLNPFKQAALIREHWHWYVVEFFYVNYFLLLFNLLPIYPLDGGQLFWSILWPFVGLQRATVLAAQVGLGGAIVLGGLGITRGHFMLVAIAIFGGMTCWQRLQMARHGVLVDERYVSYGGVTRPRRRGRAWSGWFARRRANESPPVNPNPGGWQARVEEEKRLDAEVDRILQKVHEHGIQSLTYVERQTLERATRERQRS